MPLQIAMILTDIWYCLKVAWNCRKHLHTLPSIKDKINKTHMNEFAGRYASEVSRDDWRAPGTSGTFQPDLCVNLHTLDTTSVGHLHGTHGTRPRDGCNPNVEVCRHMSLFLVFSPTVAPAQMLQFAGRARELEGWELECRYYTIIWTKEFVLLHRLLTH